MTAVTKIQEGDMKAGQEAAACAMGVVPETPGAGQLACAQLRVNWVQIQDQAGLLATGPAYQRAKRYPGVAPLMWIVCATLTFLFETLPAALRLSRVFRDEAPDIVHVCNGFRGNLDAIVAARFSGIPCVVHCNGFEKHSYIERFYASGAACAVCMTVAIEQHCRDQRLRPPEYNVVYDGLDLKAFRPTRDRNDVREELLSSAIRPKIISLFLLLAVGPQLIGHSSLNWALKFFSATLVAVFILGEPIGASLLAYFILGETPGAGLLGGGAMVLRGIYLAAREERKLGKN